MTKMSSFCCHGRNLTKEFMMKTVAIIGCGKRGTDKEGWAIGHAHAQGYLKSGHDVRILGVDVSPENLNVFGEAFNLSTSQLFSSAEALYAACTPDIVSICTWPALHHPMMLEAIQKGVKGIACEKPFATDTAQIREIEAKAAKAGTRIVVAHQRRCDAYADAFRQVISEGTLGDNLQVIAHVGDDWDILSWTTHWFDMANYLFEAPPAWVLAGMQIGENHRYKHAVEDASVVYADYGKRGSGLFLTGPGKGCSFRLHGDKGVARIGKTGIDCATFEGFRHVPFPAKSRVGFAGMLDQLITWMDGGPEARCSIGRSAVATEMAFAAQESARTGQKIELPLTRALFAPLEVVQHPVHTGWHSAWLPQDEVFVALKESAPVEIGLTATISSGIFPAAWRLKEKPHIGAWMPGHRRDAWNVPAMRDGIARTLLSLL